jgi:signal transduction histidine kinase
VTLMERATVRYAVAIVISAAALYGRYLLTPLLGLDNPYHTIWMAMVFCSWYCGVGPSVLASVMCALGIDYFFLPPAHSFMIRDAAQVYGLLTFLLFSAIITVLGESNRRAVSALKIAEAGLKAAKDNLGLKIEERTTELQEKNQELQKQTEVVRALTGHLLRLQDEERRRIARELHDSVGQALAAMSMNIAKVFKERTALSPEARKCVEENEALVAETAAEIRTLSHLLHPPLLDEAGLEFALNWLVDGFAQRSNIAVEVEVSQPFERLAVDLELAIFRIVQECLTNIHRHSGSRSARIYLSQDDGFVHCEISDDGKGIAPEKQLVMNSPGMAGVGFRGMRERVKQLDGALEIHSNGNGTTVTVDLPIKVHSEVDEALKSASSAASSASSAL